VAERTIPRVEARNGAQSYDVVFYMSGVRVVLRTLLCLVALAASARTQTKDPPEGPSQPEFTVRVTEILVPVTVHDRDGNIVNGLQPRQFHLTDNTKEQNIGVDVTYHPMSLVVAIQANGAVDAILPQVKKIGSLLESLVAGDQGEVAVAAFDHRFQVKQEFTSDLAKISEAFKKITAGSSTSALIDAMDNGVRLLRNRPSNRRRVMLVIAETRDYGSEGKMRTALLDAQLANVIVYTVNMSRMIATLTNKPYPGPGPLNGLPPATYSMPSSVPATPTTVMQKGVNPGTNADVVPLLVEILRDVKSIFVDNPAEKMTKATGGQEFGFFKQRGLEDAIAKIGSELHSQYMITYNPNNKDEGGWHDIKVTIPGRPDLKVRARPGYWMASLQ
jgi:VWFA-related protein